MGNISAFIKKTIANKNTVTIFICDCLFNKCTNISHF